MKSIMLPDLYVQSYQQINLANLKAIGINGIIFDLDNTLIQWGKYSVSEELIQFIAKMKNSGFKVCIVSNNFGQRISDLAKLLAVPIVQSAKKPSRRSFYQAMKIMGTDSTTTAMVGDQIFTDIIGGNRSGLITILVDPISKNEFFGTKMVRLIEQLFMSILKRGGYLKREDLDR